MIELLILFELNRKILTMYGVSKSIKEDFSAFTAPSYGTIKPALKRLEAGGFVRTQKEMSKGGRPSVYYSITDSGARELKRLLLIPPLDNPVKFLTASRIKLVCADILDKDEQKDLLRQLKTKAENILVDAKNMMNRDLSYYPRMVFDNLMCEYENLITLIEGFERACSR